MKLDRKRSPPFARPQRRPTRALITRLAGENGINLAGFTIRPDDIASVRRALEMATDEDIDLAAQQISRMRRSGN